MRSSLSATCCCRNFWSFVLCLFVCKWPTMLPLMLGNVVAHGWQNSDPAETFRPWSGKSCSRLSLETFLGSVVMRVAFERPRGPSGALRFFARARSCAASSVSTAAGPAASASGTLDDEAGMLTVRETVAGLDSTPSRRARLICVREPRAGRVSTALPVATESCVFTVVELMSDPECGLAPDRWRATRLAGDGESAKRL